MASSKADRTLEHGASHSQLREKQEETKKIKYMDSFRVNYAKEIIGHNIS